MKSSRFAIALAGVVLLTVVGSLVALPLLSRARVALPQVNPAALITSVRQAKPGPMAGTVRMVDRLGLSMLGVAPNSISGFRTARLWSDGTGKRRISLPSNSGERTIVNDGHTVWAWDSTTRTATAAPAHAPAPAGPHKLARFQGGELMGNPADAASTLLTMLEPFSVIRVDPDDVVAERPAYELVLDPLPTERTMLREVRVAVDGQTRLPLEVTVLANGSSDPALRIGFSDIRFGPQDPALFSFTPPSGARVDQWSTGLAERADGPARTPREVPARRTRLFGNGWATVLVRKVGPVPPPGTPLADPMLERLSSPISGAWGHGRLISTAIGNAVLTSDGRLAVGAVPSQVLTEALGQ